MASIVNLQVKNFGDDEFGVSINDDRRWRRLNTLWNSVRSRQFQHRDVKNRMNRSHVARQLECP
jgi:hypothetical protein